MASQSLYRKWRSQTFSDLIGQEAVVRTLLNAVREGRLAHAYLFCGPRGIGKTSMARLLAKAVNCANPRNGEPCNECVSCQEITAGRSPDVIEIDAASNNSVENIRDLRGNVNLLGSDGHYRVFVIDEAHMLSTQAFNALLKTLEEPPPHVIFVFATTEAHKVLPTIVSRCQRFNFGRFNMRDLVARLRHVAEGEGLELEPAAADLLARAAQGGMRDALSLLDQAMAYCGTSIDLERTRTMLGLADPGAIRRIIEHVAAQQSAEGLHIINEMVTNGADLRQLNAQLTDEWRALVLARAGADVAALMDRSEDEAREITALAQHFSLEELAACARVFTRNDAPARGLPVPQLALELSFLECLAIKRNGASSTVTQPSALAASSLAPQREASPVTRSTSPAASASVPPPAPPVTPVTRPYVDGGTRRTSAETLSTHGEASRWAPTPPGQATSIAPGVDELDLAAIANGTAAPPTTMSPAPFAEPMPEDEEVALTLDDLPVSLDLADSASMDDRFVDEDAPASFSSDAYADWLGQAQSRWGLIKQVCKQKSMSVAALLNSARPVLVEPGDVPVLVLQADYQFHLDKLRDPKSRVAIEWAVEQVLSMPLRVRMMLSNSNGNGSDSGGPTGSGGQRGGPSAPRNPNPSGPNGANGNDGSYSGKNGNGQTTGKPRPVSRDDVPPAGRSASASASPDVPPNGHNGHTANRGKNGNLRPVREDGDEISGKNGNGYAGSSADRDATAAYMPANVTPIRPVASRATPRLEDEVRADAVIQTLLKSGIELADVRPLQDDE